VGVDPGVEYSKNPVNGEVKLILRNGLTGEAVKEILKGKYELLWLYYGNFEEMYSLPLKQIKGKVYFQSSESQDVSWVSGLSSINTLTIRGKVKGKINFSRMNYLRYCDLEWCAATKGIIESSLALDSLGLSNFSGKLTGFCKETAESISVLGLTGSMESLEGIKYFTSLMSLSIWNMKNLSDISELPSCKALKNLQIEGWVILP